MTEFRIRPVRVEDVEDVNEIRRQPGVIEHLGTSLPSERVDDNRSFIRGLGERDHVLVAVADDAEAGRELVVGMAGLHVKAGPMRHTADLGIMVRTEWQGRGVGRALMEALLEIADDHLGLKRVELGVLSTNDRAIGLYEKLGFEHEGCKRANILRDGRFEDTLIMGRLRDGD